jgi:hypothetical protein
MRCSSLARRALARTSPAAAAKPYQVRASSCWAAVPACRASARHQLRLRQAGRDLTQHVQRQLRLFGDLRARTKGIAPCQKSAKATKASATQATRGIGLAYLACGCGSGRRCRDRVPKPGRPLGLTTPGRQPPPEARRQRLGAPSRPAPHRTTGSGSSKMPKRSYTLVCMAFANVMTSPPVAPLPSDPPPRFTSTSACFS